MAKALIGVIVAIGAVVSLAASRRNSLTFDESFMIAAGARAVQTGDYSMAWDQPIGMLYLYGGAVHVYDAVSKATGGRGVAYPDESGTYALSGEILSQLPKRLGLTTTAPRWGMYNRYDYAREFFVMPGNDPVRIGLAARAVTALICASLALLIAWFAWRQAGPVAAVVATAAFSFSPDVLAHGAIAHNDVALAASFLAATLAIDAFVRDPSLRRAAISGCLVGLALCTKFSAIAIGPVGIVLLAVEAFRRRRDADWYRRLALGSLVALVTVFAVLVLAYRGDFLLYSFREGLGEVLGHRSGGHGVPAFLLGRMSDTGFWYYYPVGLVLKSTVAFHLLALAAVAGWFIHHRRDGSRPLESPMRAVVIAALVFLAILMQSELNIGVRYALPLVPLIALMVGIGIARLWQHRGRLVRAGLGALLVASASLSLRHYPWFLSYVTEYVSPRSSYRALSDSGFDWGQGLIALKEFMDQEGVPAVYLSYFGSMLPESYGIKYSALPSWRPLPEGPTPSQRYEWVVISATHLNGLYQVGDPFRQLRGRLPDRVIANSLFAFRIQ